MTINIDRFLTSSEHDGVDHKSTPFNLLDANAHEFINHELAPFSLMSFVAHNTTVDHSSLLGVPGLMQSDLSFVASGTSINSGVLGFTPTIAIMVLTDQSNASAVHGIALIKGTTSNQLSLYFNAFNGGGSTTQSNAGGNWSCTQFSSSGVIVSGTNTYGVGLLVLGQ